MKNFLFLILAIFALSMNAQSFEIGAGAGTGAYYFIEETDDDVNTEYSSPASIYLDVKFNFKDRIDGVKLRLQNTNVNVVGQDYQTSADIDGTVESFTMSLLYERLRSDKLFSIGYNAGLGYTQQDFVQVKNQNNPALEDRFMSVSFNGIFSLRLQDKLRLNLDTGLLWTDPINTFRGSDDWQTAGEDLSFLSQLGVSYRF